MWREFNALTKVEKILGSGLSTAVIATTTKKGAMLGNVVRYLLSRMKNSSLLVNKFASAVLLIVVFISVG
jgi:hypothetical protein